MAIGFGCTVNAVIVDRQFAGFQTTTQVTPLIASVGPGYSNQTLIFSLPMYQETERFSNAFFTASLLISPSESRFFSPLVIMGICFYGLLDIGFSQSLKQIKASILGKFKILE